MGADLKEKDQKFYGFLLPCMSRYKTMLIGLTNIMADNNVGRPGQVNKIGLTCA